MSQVSSIAAASSGGVSSIIAGNNISATGSPNVTVSVAGTTNHAVQVGNASAALTSLPLGSSGQVLTSQGAGADPQWAAPASGSSWVEVTGTSQAAAVNTNYVANNVGLVDIILPATAAFGSVISVVGKGDGGWQVSGNAGQTIYFGNQSTSFAALASTHPRDTVILVCITANTEWQVWHGPQGNITVIV